jgi:hypothetical protein
METKRDDIIKMLDTHIKKAARRQSGIPLYPWLVQATAGESRRVLFSFG